MTLPSAFIYQSSTGNKLHLIPQVSHRSKSIYATIFFMTKCFILISFLSLISILAEAQYSRYIVTFKNKTGTPYSLSNPSQFLSAKSLTRRSRQTIAIDSTDLPITPSYIESINSIANVRILNKSKWLNQVCISTTDQSALAKINSLTFVKATTPIALRSMPAGDRNGKLIEQEQYSPQRINNNNSIDANALNYGNTLNQIHMHNGEYLHNHGFTGEGITIAILDAGFFGYKTNPMFDSVRLQNRILGEWDFVAGEQSVNEDNNHGMFCFSIMAANKPGSMVGGSPKAKFYLYRTEDVSSEYPVEEQNWAAAAELADSLGIDMISSSLGYSDFDDHSFDHSYLQRDGNTAIITRAADLAVRKGIIVMNSAGNDGATNNDQKFVACPADGDSVTTVGAVDINKNIASFSSWGPNGAGKLKPNIVSLGVATTIAGTDGNPSSGNGTSFSNPNLAGLIACFWQAFPEYSNMTIIDAVQKSSSKYLNPDFRFGYGIPDFKKAFAILAGKSFKGMLTNDKCVTTFTWSGKDDNTMKYEIQRKAATDTGYTTALTINGSTGNFATNSYSFRDTLKYTSPQAVRYLLKQTLPGDSVIILMDSTINIASACAVSSGITVSPNPVSNVINLTINASEAIQKMSIGLYNILGQRLYYYEGSIPSGVYSKSIPAVSLATGVYIITVRNDQRIIYSSKVIK